MIETSDASAWPAITTPPPAAPAVAAVDMPPHRLSVVVPLYNEIDNAAAQIDAVQEALMHYGHPWELIVVDDGSTDGTGAALQRHAARVGAHVRVIRLLRNFRQTESGRDFLAVNTVTVAIGCRAAS